MKRANPARRAKEWARAYGSLERVYYISNHLACSVDYCFSRDIVNAHTETGGAGRKADAETVIPLCNLHHAEYHKGAKTFVARYGIDLFGYAADTEMFWQLYGPDVVARAKADGRYARWLARHKESDET